MLRKSITSAICLSNLFASRSFRQKKKFPVSGQRSISRSMRRRAFFFFFFFFFGGGGGKYVIHCIRCYWNQISNTSMVAKRDLTNRAKVNYLYEKKSFKTQHGRIPIGHCFIARTKNYKCWRGALRRRVRRPETRDLFGLTLKRGFIGGLRNLTDEHVFYCFIK